MSVEFYCVELDEPGVDVRFVCYGRTAPSGARSSLEFGSQANFDEVLSMMEMGFTFLPVGHPQDPRVSTADDLRAALHRGEVTFGTFGGVTVAAGSESHFRFMGEV
jgi:hypothetical protein